MPSKTLTEAVNRIDEIDTTISNQKTLLLNTLKEKGLNVNDSDTLSTLINNVKNINGEGSVPQNPSKNFMIAGYEFYIKVTRKLFRSVPGQPETINFDWGPHIDIDKIISDNNLVQSESVSINEIERTVDPIATNTLFFTLDAFHENKIIGYTDSNNIFNIVSKEEICVLDAGALFKWTYGIKNITNFEKLNFKNVSSIDHLFDDAEMLTSITLPASLKERNTIYGKMTDIFNYCLGATEIDVTNLNLSKVKDITNLFHHCEALTNIVGLNTLDISSAETVSYAFAYTRKLPTIDVSNFNTSNIVEFDRMFYHADSVQELNVSGWNTSKAKTMHSMFNSCYKLKSINVSNFDTSKVTDMWGMFRNCNDLVTLDLTSFNTSNVIDMEEMFYSCDLIETIDISSFNTSKVTHMRNMFANCPNLKTIWVGPNWKVPSKYTLADIGIVNETNPETGESIIKQKATV